LRWFSGVKARRLKAAYAPFSASRDRMEQFCPRYNFAMN
jgi:hypothetical protein